MRITRHSVQYKRIIELSKESQRDVERLSVKIRPSTSEMWQMISGKIVRVTRQHRVRCRAKNTDVVHFLEILLNHVIKTGI